MLFKSKSKKLNKKPSSWLYETVYTGSISTLVILLLMASFMIQPFHKAIAAEPVEEVAPEPDPVAADVAPQAPTEEVPLVVGEVAPDPTFIEQTPEPTDVTEPTEPEPPVDPDVVTEEGGASESATTTEEGTTEPAEENTETEPEEEISLAEQMTEPPEDPNGSSTQIVQVESLITEANYYQFSKQSCVSVGDGAYHCTDRDVSGIDMQSVVYSDKGADGSMEIFLRTTRGKIKQITENVYDDTSPNYDPESMRIVYQRLIDGRYQIVLFDIMEEKEMQLTFSKTNNMEPKVASGGIVWQAWDGNDWEIMFFDGQYTEQITNNETEDVVPVIQDGYILWNVLGGTEQQARVYSMDSKETTPIVGYEGGSIINPRFMLVYDTEFDNGDVVTQSFDPSTGISEPIAAKPAPEPVNIPNNDPTGEIRALITSGKAQKDEKELHDVDGGDGSDAAPVATSTPGTLDLKAPTDGINMNQIIIPGTASDAPFELTEYDLVIPEGAYEEALNAQE